MKTFEELGVSEQIRHAIEELGFEQPMPVQEEVIPYLLGTRNDVIALAQTGTGKTAAFGIPLLQRVDGFWHSPLTARGRAFSSDTGHRALSDA